MDLEPFEPPPRKVRSRAVHTRPPFVAISTVWSDLRRYRRLSCTIVRSKASEFAYDDVNVISDDLAQSDTHLDL